MSQDGQDGATRRHAPQPAHKKKTKVGILQGFQTFEAGGKGSCGYNSGAAAYFMATKPGCQQPTEKIASQWANIATANKTSSLTKMARIQSPRWATDATWTVTTDGGPVPPGWGECKNLLI